ncbi:MAG: DUF6443 domain-containing protein [Bacteroidota bacterium]
MRTILLIIILIGIELDLHAQLHFSIDNTNPCAGQPVTFSLPSIPGCTNVRVASQSGWKISPTPSAGEVRYNYSAVAKGYTSVTITYTSYHATISVSATYNCDNGSSGAVSDLINMRSPLSGKPTISGLDESIYSGDQTTTTTSLANAVSYSWSLAVVQTISGSIDQTVFTNPSSQQTIIKWPASFVGTVDVTATATGCSAKSSTTRRVNVLSPPSVSFYESSVAPTAHCTGSLMRYRIEPFGGSAITKTQVIVTGGATSISVFSSKNGVPVEWAVNWIGDGDLRIRYSLSVGSRTWIDKLTSPISYDVLEYDAGQIHPIPLLSYCAPASIILSLDRQPAGSAYTFQYCNSGDCSVASSNWANNNPPTSPAFTGVSTNTSFRIKLSDNRCGAFQSTPVMITVKQTPSIPVSDKFIFSGGVFGIPSADMPFSTIDVKTKATGVTGASDLSLQQGSTTGVLSTQVLTTNSLSDGTVVYSITPTTNGCKGQTKNATVTVYNKPIIATDQKYVYKGRIATLKTGSYDSYLWQTTSGDVLGNDPTYKVSAPGNYQVRVTKHGTQATSDAIRIDSQLSGVNENYILTRQPQKKFTSAAGIDDKSEKEVSENIQYFDGLARPMQNIGIRMSPLHHDVIQPFVYDESGRESTKYLPYVSTEDNGRIRHDAASEQSNFYRQTSGTIPFDLDPYSRTVFEGSPLNRVVKQGSAGTAWQPNVSHPEMEHVVRHQYELISSSDSVMRFTYNYENETVTWSYFTSGSIFKNTTKDEDNHEVIEFIDKLDRTICRKVKAGNNVYACTYYVFDDLGNLVVVVPPEGAKALAMK